MAIMPNVLGTLLQNAETLLKTAGVLVPASIGYFGGGTLKTQQGLVPGAAATWPITVIWVNQKSQTFGVDGLSAPAPVPTQILAQNPAPGVTIAANATVVLTAVAPAIPVSYPGTNLVSF